MAFFIFYFERREFLTRRATCCGYDAFLYIVTCTAISEAKGSSSLWDLSVADTCVDGGTR